MNNKKRQGLNNINSAGVWGLLSYIWKGHVTNWFWRDRTLRRNVREQAHKEILTKEFDKFIPYIKSLKAPETTSVIDPQRERVFVMWLQGEENAPKVIKACIKSVRERTGEKFTLLKDEDIKNYIELPEYVWEKKEKGEMIGAHFSDIVRIELLWQYGGYWVDASCYMTGDFPSEVDEAGFFMLMADGRYNPHMFVQNCFIRAKSHDPLLGMWRELVWHYWKETEQPRYYFIVQTLFKLLVTHNAEAKALFEKMPKLHMDPTHVLWHEIGNLPFDMDGYEEMCRATFFQKCSHKPQRGSTGVNQIIPGSFADVVINRSHE